MKEREVGTGHRLPHAFQLCTFKRIIVALYHKSKVRILYFTPIFLHFTLLPVYGTFVTCVFHLTLC